MHQNFNLYDDEETIELDFERRRLPFYLDESPGTYEDEDDADDVYYDAVCGVFKVKGG